MSAFHHKAELIDATLPTVRYRYLPRAYDENPASGIFEVSVDSWEVTIVEAVDETSDRGVVNALVHKLKKQMPELGSPPKTIWHIG